MMRCWYRAHSKGAVRARLLPVLFFFAFALEVHPLDTVQSDASPARGDSAMAYRYALLAKSAIEEGLWGEALAGLERASDFAGVSSDISYLLALARSHENKSRGSVLEALERSLAVNIWNLCESESARLMKAGNLIALRAYSQALAELSMVRRSPEEAALTLKALALFKPDEFRRTITEVLDRYPREIEPVKIFLNFLKNEDALGRNPVDYGRDQVVLMFQRGKDDLELLELIVRRLPVLLLKDPELAWMAAPFIRDRDDARRMIMAYRAVNEPAPASIPIALALGVIDDETAIEELFRFSSGKAVIDIALLDETWELLRRVETRAVFMRNLSRYSGVITEDTDKDGFFEIFVEYSGGTPCLCTYDANQDRAPDMILYFEAGDPVRAQVYIPPDGNRGSGLPAGPGMAAVQWERYPSVLDVELDGVRYIPRPMEFNFSPFRFVELLGSPVLFSRADPLSPPLTRRVLVANALRIERPSLEFRGGVEQVELNQGIPVRAREFVGDLMVSETGFLRGRPQLQWVDLDFDGRMETVRYFARNYRQVELEELWNYDRDFSDEVLGE